MASRLSEQDSRNFPSAKNMSGQSGLVFEEGQVVHVACTHDVPAIVVKLAVSATEVVSILGRAKIVRRGAKGTGPGAVESDQCVARELCFVLLREVVVLYIRC